MDYDIDMMDWQFTPPAAELNEVYNPGKLTFHSRLESETCS